MIHTETIEELHRLLTEKKRLGGKVAEVQTALSQVKKKISESLVQQYVTTSEEKIAIKEDLMREEQSYERLLQALRDMHKEIEDRIRPVEEQIVQAEVDYLKNLFEQKKVALMDCLGKIDQKILECRLDLTEYNRIQTDLNALNDRVSRLGSGTLPVPEFLSTTNLADIVVERIEGLRSQGKL
ncbi:MAG: hypothetical protein ACE5HC_13040 [Candidatus Binatia bacterium]